MKRKELYNRKELQNFLKNKNLQHSTMLLIHHRKNEEFNKFFLKINGLLYVKKKDLQNIVDYLELRKRNETYKS